MSKIFAKNPNKGVKFADHGTSWLTFRDYSQKELFELFQSNQTSLYVMVSLHLFATFYYGLAKLGPYLLRPSHLTLFNFLFGLIFPFSIGCIIITMRVIQKINLFVWAKHIHCQKLLVFLESIYSLTTCISLSIGVILAAQHGPCTGAIDDFVSGWDCMWYNSNQMPDDLMFGTMIMPFLLSMIVKGTRWRITVLSFILILVCDLLVMQFYDRWESLQSFCIFGFMCVLVMYENRRQSMSLFLLTQNQENLLLENERLANETHATEMRSMIGNVAHDLKTPLAAYMSGMDVILQVLVDARNTPITEIEKRRANHVAILDAIHNMKNVSEFMLMTINRCIDYTKASQGLKLVPRKETINFAESINLPLRCMKDLQQDQKMEIIFKPLSADIAESVITDKGWLQENILCLLSNAVKYSVGGNVSIEAILTTHAKLGVSLAQMESTKSNELPSDHVVICIEIEDSGIGISEDMIVNLFSPFKQAQRMAGGTGLGLYSLAKRIDALGGSYGVKQRADGKSGSVFWFTIPYRPDETPKQLLVKIEEDGPPGGLLLFGGLASPTSKKIALNILIVDDSLSILKMSGMMLKRQGHTIATAENGAIAVDMITSASASSTPYDVVLMDLQMPVMDGLEATSRVRRMESAAVASFDTVMIASKDSMEPSPNRAHKKHQLIIGVSANSDNETMEAAFAAGIDAFIPKPFTMQSFTDTHNKLLMSKSTKT